jgi:hypothetical protein
MGALIFFAIQGIRGYWKQASGQALMWEKYNQCVVERADARKSLEHWRSSSSGTWVRYDNQKMLAERMCLFLSEEDRESVGCDVAKVLWDAP